MKMQTTTRNIGLGTILAFSALCVTQAQSPETSGPVEYSNQYAAQAAPIVRTYPGGRTAARQLFDSQPSPGVTVRSDVSNGVETVTSSSSTTELRVVQGRADVTVHHPADHSQILVDLPNGQVALLKDGLYTFNAATNTVRVLHGEAAAFSSAKDDSKGVKVKETQQLAFFTGVKLKAVESYPYELTADLLPENGRDRGDGPYDEPYGEGFYGGYPFYAGAYGYPWGYGFGPYGYGYPFGVGLGFGYSRGFGGYRGGFRR